MKVGGKWKYLFRAVDKQGRLIDLRLSDRRNTRAAHRFLGEALTIMRHWPPSSIITDKLGSYPKAISRLQRHCLTCKPQMRDEIRLVNKLFDVFAAAA